MQKSIFSLLRNHYNASRYNTYSYARFIEYLSGCLKSGGAIACLSSGITGFIHSQIVYCLSAERTIPIVQIGGICVEKTAQSSGLGGLLVKTLEQYHLKSGHKIFSVSAPYDSPGYHHAISNGYRPLEVGEGALEAALIDQQYGQSPDNDIFSINGYNFSCNARVATALVQRINEKYGEPQSKAQAVGTDKPNSLPLPDYSVMYKHMPENLKEKATEELENSLLFLSCFLHI
jgi:hypothetical protein